MSVKHFSNDTFQSEVLQGSGPILVDFWAPWCGPCRMVSPVLDTIAEETPSVKVCKVNVDEQPELAQTFKVMSIPTLAALRDGKLLIACRDALYEVSTLKPAGGKPMSAEAFWNGYCRAANKDGCGRAVSPSLG